MIGSLTAAVVLAALIAGGVLVWHAVADRGGTPQPTTPPSARAQGLPQGVPGAPSASPSATAGSWYSGTWVGTAEQPLGRVTRWTARLTFPAAGNDGTFVLPSMGCSGTLVVTAAGPSTALAHEQVTRNPRGLCALQGIFALVRSGPNTMNMAWQDASDKNNVAAGHLTRTTPSG